MKGRAIQPCCGPGLRMLVNFGSEVFDQFLLSRHGLDQSLELGSRNGGLGRSRDDGSRSDRGRKGSDSGIDRGTR